MEEKHIVNYYILNSEGSDTKVKRIMNQKELGKLLMRDDIILSNVNEGKRAYYRKKKR